MIFVLDILYLNKLRLVAVEELNKANREKQLLLDKIQQLEAVNKLGLVIEFLFFFFVVKLFNK
jgi:hypothetical protein